MAASLILAGCHPAGQSPVYDILSFGAVGDGLTDCTAAINTAIAQCGPEGGVVRIPAGTYLCGTLFLQDKVTLHLDQGATLLASDNLDDYASYIPKKDLSKYSSGVDGQNANNASDPTWMKALIIGDGVSDVAIEGEGVIDGRHVFNLLGEEGMRGPHTIVLAEASGFRMEGISVLRSANYAFLGYEIQDAAFRNLYFGEGWDGIHIRGGQHIDISECRFETGDDCIGGGYWEDMTLTDCYLNSSCDGVRMFMPASDFVMDRCVITGPGRFPHRTSGKLQRRNLLSGVIIEPGEWGPAPGELRGIILRNLEIQNAQSPVAVNLCPGAKGYDLTLDHVTATGAYGVMTPILSQEKDTGFETIILRDCSITR